MKIIYFSPHPHVNMSAPSGPGTHIREVIHGFEQRGHTVIKLIAGGETMEQPSGNIEFRNRSWKKLIPSYLWQSLKDFSLRKLDRALEKTLLTLIEKEKPDMIYERAYYLMGSGYRAAKKTNTRYCCEVNAPYPEEKTAMNGKSLFFNQSVRNEALQIQSAYKVFVVSSALKSYLEERTSHSTHKIIVTPNAVNPVHINLNDTLANEVRTTLGVQQDDVVIGFVGSIFPYHGVDTLIEAFHLIRARKKVNVKLVIVGDGEILDQLRQRSIELGLNNDVLFTGNVPHKEVYTYISLMDITVMARSNWYGSPVKIFEYGIMNKCIIAPDVIPVRDVMVNKQDGILVADDLQMLTSSITECLDNPKQAKQMAKNFFNKVKTHHTWQQVSDTILEECK